MSQVNMLDSMDRIVDILESVRTKGVSLWSANGELHFKGPRSALNQAEIEALRLSKAQIVALLECSAAAQTAEPKLEPRPSANRAPLTLSQLGRWRSCHLYERKTIRQVAAAMRVHGRLRLYALERSVTEIVRRHQALRTRIVICDGVPTQDIAEASEYRLEVSDLTAMDHHLQEPEVQRSIEEVILEPIKVSVGPLFKIRLLRLGENEHILIVAMEHIISDGFSLNVFWSDLFSAYSQALKGKEFSLPAIPIQLADYAVWQRNARESWVEMHDAFWNDYLAGCPRLKFPDDATSQISDRRGWGTVNFEIGSELKAELCEWCRLRRTTLAIAVFTAYAGMTLRWCDVSEGAFQYPIDARASAAIQNTIGFFASMIYLRIKLNPDDCLVDLMGQVRREYCRVYEHADPHDLSARVPAPEVTRAPLFNWVPRTATQTRCPNAGDAEDAIRCTPVAFEHPMGKYLELDAEPSIVFFDAEGGEVSGELSFPLNRFAVETMARFAQNLLVFIKALVRDPDRRLRDFPLV